MNDEKIIKSQMQEQFIQQHTEWLRHPITTAFLKALRSHKEDFTNIISTTVASPTVTDAQIRHYGISVRDFDTCLKLASSAQLIMDKNLRTDNKTNN